MSVVDAPPGVDFAGTGVGEFRARLRTQRLANISFVVCLGLGALTVAIASRALFKPGTAGIVVGALVCVSVAGVGYAVRKARVRIERGGIRWGWRHLSVRMSSERIREVAVYERCVAIVPRRGSTWFLSRYDWSDFGEFPAALEAAELSVQRKAGEPPWRSRLQGYGLVLDLLVVGAMLGSVLILGFALVR